MSKSEIQKFLDKFDLESVPTFTSGEGESEELHRALMVAYSLLQHEATVRTDTVKFRADLGDVTDEEVADAIQDLRDNIRGFLLGGVMARFKTIEVGHDVVEENGVNQRRNPHYVVTMEVFSLKHRS